MTYVCRMLGYTGDELCTMSLRDFTHPDDVAENEALLRRALDGEIGSYQFEKRYLHQDGHVVWGRVSASLVRDQDGKPAYFVTPSGGHHAAQAVGRRASGGPRP